MFEIPTDAEVLAGIEKAVAAGTMTVFDPLVDFFADQPVREAQYSRKVRA